MSSILSPDSMASSPTRSSSPPLTPASSSCAYIRHSSPTEESFRRQHLYAYTDDPWRHYTAPLTTKQPRDLEMRLQDTDDENDDYLDIFAPENTRFTFFMVSAERGRWKTDPMPHSRISKSEPTSGSLVTSCHHSSPRSVSEPAPVLEPLTHVQPEPEENGEELQTQERRPLSPLPPSSPPLSTRSSSPFLSSSPLSSPISVNLSLDDSFTPNSSAPVTAVLGPRENVDSKVRRPIKGTVPDKKKRKKEDRPAPEPTKKKRKVDVKTPSTPPDGDEEIRGILIECMALSRASSMPVSSLYKSVMQTQPALKAQQSETEWACVFQRVLDAGRETGLFGMVESSGKDEQDRPLEPQWFYVPEMDSDQERAALIRSMMPRPGKRSETKKYKQYYYRQWDCEDGV
ncbi:hypothetical protein M378DRAFT_171884 [Amanita muscaria Koide BX008]|uniref:Uncharacterized protein n=1 Tax=Amanita muscaria (strain Koide BX008) TaxID=946122 RepID=A0A0C2W7Z9_AMAMK|nr:hypothetical protein M378DRAFT_171884 [Amanita muscaria Koide BX008]